MAEAGALPWHRRARHRLRHSLKARMVAVFLLLALALATVFIGGMQKAIGIGWRDAARPLVNDYVDRLAAEIGTPPDVDRARALTQRLPITVDIEGPATRWHSRSGSAAWPPETHGDWARETGLFTRHTADGHRIDFGLNVNPWRDRPRAWGWFTLFLLLLLTALAYAYVRHLLRPLEDIRTGAQRFGRGEFGTPIPLRRNDELGDLAAGVNTMARSIHQMLEAKRGLLLAISHELRSPITRARVNTELLPEDGEFAPRREALLRDLNEMAGMVTELLESERLGQGHAALHRETTDLVALAQEAAAGTAVRLDLALHLPPLQLDRARIRLLLRNLLDNAQRHGAATEPPLLRIHLDEPGRRVVVAVRDHGAGVDAAVLPLLAEPFYRPDASRERSTGGVGLGLYLCRLIAEAHGGSFVLRNAQPGLEAEVGLPL